MVIGDSHAKPGVSNQRYKWAGRFAAEHRPHVIVDIGDHGDFESLCSYDKGKGSFEGRRLQADFDAVYEARELFANEIAKAAGYKPRLVYTLGNHEQRLLRWLDETPEMQGVFGLETLRAKEFGWKQYPYLQPVTIDGITYIHSPVNPTTGKEIAGMHKGHAALTKGLSSIGYGHDHRKTYYEGIDNELNKKMGFGVGCYMDPGQYESYAGLQGNANWWSGLVLIHDVSKGYGDVEWISTNRVKRQFGS